MIIIYRKIFLWALMINIAFADFLNFLNLNLNLNLNYAINFYNGRQRLLNAN